MTAAVLHTRAALDTRKINKLIIDATGARELLGLHGQHGPSFNDVNLATCWSRLGRVRGPERSWLRSDDGTRLLALREQTTDQVRTLGARQLSNTAHAIAKLDLRGTAWGILWKDLEGAALARRSEFEPQNLANLAWAFATAGRATHALLDAVAEESAGRVRDFEPQHLANTAWAFATAGHAAPALFDAIGREAARRVRELNPQNLANTAWAFATAGHAAPALFDAIGREAAGRVRELNPQALANTAWAFAKAGHAAPALFVAIGRESAGRVRELNPQTWPTRRWRLPRMAMPPRRSSTRLGRRLQGGYASSSHRSCPTRRGRLQFWTICRRNRRSSTSASPWSRLATRPPGRGAARPRQGQPWVRRAGLHI